MSLCPGDFAMKKIILASGSPQRRKLLKLLGLKFTVRPSRVKEFTKIKSTVSAFVKHNALLKAQDIASKAKEGIVIGADTTVYIGRKRIIGKPRNLKDAKRILKILFSKPQWIYTGVAVIDTKTGRKIIDYEKTKVFMTPLSDKEIDLYHRKVHPFDKAGGFDIEGWGSIFIRRIEGCYSNVIGLPLAKLFKMLKKVGVSVLSLLIMLNLTGCITEYNLATKREERYIYGTEKEVRLGEKVAQKIEKKYDIVTEVEANERVRWILDKIVEVSDRKDIVYFIKILDKDIMNAASLPGGYIFVFTGMLDKIENDDQLAGVIAHEVGHITAKHGIKRLQNAYGAMAIQVLASEAGGNVAGGVGLALTSLFTAHSQQDEFQSDRLAVKYMRKAGFDPNEMVRFLEKLKKEKEKEPIRKFSYWRTHPHVSKRIAVVNQEITGKMEFKDYLKLIGDE